jgi:hypothetical protein
MFKKKGKRNKTKQTKLHVTPLLFDTKPKRKEKNEE